MSEQIRIDPTAMAEIQAMSDKYVAETVLPKISDAAKRIVPIDTGELHDHISPVVNADGMFVVADTDYAAFVEQGTSKMSAQPYLRPALYTNLGE